MFGAFHWAVYMFIEKDLYEEKLCVLIYVEWNEK